MAEIVYRMGRFQQKLKSTFTAPHVVHTSPKISLASPHWSYESCPLILKTLSPPSNPNINQKIIVLPLRRSSSASIRLFNSPVRKVPANETISLVGTSLELFHKFPDYSTIRIRRGQTPRHCDRAQTYLHPNQHFATQSTLLSG